YYRNTDAFSFHNFNGKISLDTVEQEFGTDQTTYTIWNPFGDDAHVPTPGTLLYLGAAAAAFNNNGFCFGMALTSQPPGHHPEWINAANGLPAGAMQTVFSLQQNGNLDDMIKANHLAQWSSEMIRYYAGWQTSSHSSAGIYNQLRDLLAGGDHPLIS